MPCLPAAPAATTHFLHRTIDDSWKLPHNTKVYKQPFGYKYALGESIEIELPKPIKACYVSVQNMCVRGYSRVGAGDGWGYACVPYA